MKNSYLDELREIEPELVLKCNGKILNDFTTLIKEHLISPRSRLIKENIIKNITLTLMYGNSVFFSLVLEEFYPCCGKVLAKHLIANNGYYTYNGKNVKYDQEKLNKIFVIFMNIVDSMIIHIGYTSMSFIVAVLGQPLFYKFISTINTYKVSNTFQNERMTPKTTCVEYCKNLW